MAIKSFIPWGAFVACGLVLGTVASRADVNFNFASTNGGFTVVNGGTPAPTGPWQFGTYSTTPGGGNSWYALGTDNNGAPSVSYLLSPVFRTEASNVVSGSFSHRYSFEYDPPPTETRWDGGQMQYRVNSGAWQPVSLLFGQGYTGLIGGNNVLSNSLAFNSKSPGYDLEIYISTGFELGTGNPQYFPANTALEFRFVAAWDEFTRASLPNWQIGSLVLNNVFVQIPEPSTGMLALLGGAVGLVLRRRR